MAKMFGKGLNKRVIITSILAGIFLLVVNSAIWVNLQVFDKNNFTNTTVSSLTSQSSRDAIAGRIIDESLKDYPRIQNLADDSLTKIISGLLDGDRMQTILSKSISRLHIYLTSENQNDVVINLEGTKNTINRLAEVLSQDENNSELLQKVQNTPDQIVLIQEKNVPDFYKYGMIVSFIGPIAFLLAMILLVIPYIKDAASYSSIMLFQGLAISITGLLSLLIGPLFRPMALSPVENPNGRIIVENLYNSFLTTFNSQSYVLISLGLVLCVGAMLIPLVKNRWKKSR